MKKVISRAVLIGFISILISTVLWKIGVLKPFETITWDMRVRLLKDSSNPSDKVVLILLDQESLDWAEDELFIPWPWPRQVVSPIIDFAKRGGAKSIAFDVLYTEASSYGVFDDEAFKTSIENSDAFVGSLFLGNEEDSQWIDDLPQKEINIPGLDNWQDRNSQYIKNYSGIRYPIDEVTYGAKMLGNVRSEPERDGVYRNGKLFYVYKDKVVPSLALASYLVGNSVNNISINKNKLVIDDIEIPIDREGKSILKFRDEEAFSKYKAAAVIQSELRILEGEKPVIDPSVFKDAYVFFGYSAAGLLDLRPTPISETTAGVEIHATMMDNLLTNDFIKEQAQWLSIIIAVVMSFLAAFIFTKYQGVVKGIIIFVSFTIAPVIFSILGYLGGVWFHLIYIELALFLSLSGAGVLNYATEGKQKRYIKQAFKQYLSPDFIEHLLTSPDKLKLGGEKKELSIFFSDLEGFTTISEGLNPEDLTSLLNEYLTAMTDIILEEGGTIDKYEGDAIIAFWNAPIDYEDHALRAVRASLRCQKKLDELRPQFHERTGYNLRMRIGLNTGYAVVGNLGSNTRFDYTMLGDSVNLAARLEGINKQFGTYTMISESTYREIDGAYPARELSKVAVVGKKEAITVYEPMLQDEYKEKESILTVFNEGLKFFYNGKFKEAALKFKSIESKDPAAKKYIDKCRELFKSGIENWDGVWKMTQK